MNLKQFFVLGGIIFVLCAILGFIGVIGPTPDQSIFGTTWWFDSTENWLHFVLGILMLIIAMALPYNTQRGIGMTIGIIALLVGIYSFFKPGMLFGVNLEYPADTIFHILIGFWALLSSRKKETIEI